MNEGWKEFQPILKEQARGPRNLGPLDSETSEKAMGMILGGTATPAQISGFLLVGRARTESASELAAYTRAARKFLRPIEAPDGPSPVTVAGGFDGKLRTFNVGATATLLAAAAGGRFVIPGSEGTPPKCGRTSFDALRGIGAPVPHSREAAESSLAECGLAATTLEHYLPELHALLQLRCEMARRTALNVVEKLVSPLPGSPLMIGITHRPFLESVPAALAEFGTERALVFQAIEGSDEAPLDGNSSLVVVEGDRMEEFEISPGSLGLGRATKAHIPWESGEHEAQRVAAAMEGEEGPVRDLLIYNAALRLWMYDGKVTLEEHTKRARRALDSGAALELVRRAGGATQPVA